MTWRLAKSLDTLRAQVNAQWPKRSKVSDGTVGDLKHQQTDSDHNPRIKDPPGLPVVAALDITNDPDHGLASRALAEGLVAACDPRIKYLISNGQMCSGTGQKHPAWKWRKYTGKNSHHHHVHISVKSSKAQYDSTVPWNLDGVSEVIPKSTPATLPKPLTIRDLQLALNVLGASPLLTVDGRNGDKTRAAVRKIQKAAGLVEDGKAGALTWAAIGKRLAK